MSNTITQDRVIFKNGESFPILLDDAGKPLFYPNVYIVASKRSVNVATNPISEIKCKCFLTQRSYTLLNILILLTKSPTPTLKASNTCLRSCKKGLTMLTTK
jgi:hypothetical protein